MSVKTTNVVRYVALVAFALLVLAAVVGWWLGRDPTQLVGVGGLVVAALGVGEASNVGKRATTKIELMKEPGEVL